eukprot:TRINITY_DN20441_c0_g1_i1.p1 TRINITY_DN20441_c0_g1~~TRINITY_DN20441_c0_g1_i1.p1  ORF type:complete len:357 (+),score=78.50 TRINITY_DN20441_c0_g1_i1:79-1071(+)
MVFELDIATDLYGVKHNTKMEFVGVPTLSELIVAVEGNFDKEAKALRPDSQPFRVQTMQVYDDVLNRWVDLYNSSQLQSGAQVFVFQPMSGLNSEAPGKIPPAKVTADTFLGSPSRARVTADLGLNGILSEKVRALYHEIEQTHQQVNAANLHTYFTANEIMWSEPNLGPLFSHTGDLQFADWARWAVGYPAIIDNLYYRRFGGVVKLDQPMFTVPPTVPPTRSEVDNMAARRARELELRRSYTLGWTAERETIDEQYRAQRKADLDLQIRHLTTKNQLDRIRAYERADADAICLSRAIAANAASPPRRRDDLCRMYYSPASPRFGYLSP